MVSLERLGITGAIFATDGDVQNFAQIILDKGRTKKKPVFITELILNLL